MSRPDEAERLLPSLSTGQATDLKKFAHLKVKNLPFFQTFFSDLFPSSRLPFCFVLCFDVPSLI